MINISDVTSPSEARVAELKSGEKIEVIFN
ncbi:MAG: hypothetical protein Harvfovirus70_7 [Harvfovirus sp.]|uniref:Uncharacterized protein n=1 Tax=Harvfovirus sp. TaxID=2487768 RepID=A0A3G5A6J7_9VIRU|nr:MAG: hypothetical protein Harvfovirus70_7 [Harvfovirus sp.]